MNIDNLKELMNVMKSLDSHRVKLAIILSNVITSELPDSSESLALRLATVASLMDFVEEIKEDPTAEALHEFLDEAIEKAWEHAARHLGDDIEDVKASIMGLRQTAKDKVARMNDGDSILGGIDFSDN